MFVEDNFADEGLFEDHPAVTDPRDPLDTSAHGSPKPNHHEPCA